MQLGFHSVTAEHTDVAVDVEGQIPSWLEGTLIRNGPGRFDTAAGTVNHWFDGLAMLRAYRFADGTLRYTNRLLRTEASAAADRGQLTGQFATDGGTLSRLLRPLQLLRGAAGTDNTNVHVAAVDGALIALTETDTRIAVDPETLRVRGHFRFDDTVREDLTTAHLAVDHTTGETFGLATTFAPAPATTSCGSVPTAAGARRSRRSTRAGRRTSTTSPSRRRRSSSSRRRCSCRYARRCHR
jgi:Lignostilbene-alpha,beta-dioxygenase and related enzymes